MVPAERDPAVRDPLAGRDTGCSTRIVFTTRESVASLISADGALSVR